METTTYRIPDENLYKLRKSFEKLAAKADKLGLPAPSFEIVGHDFEPIIEIRQDHVKKEQHRVPTGRKRKVHLVQVTGEAPKLSGWTLIAIIDHFTSLDRGTNLVRRIPYLENEVELPEDFRTMEQRCDHCETVRYRKNTFALLNDQGEWKLVGSKCLKDFTGHKSPDALASFYERIFETLRNAEDYLWSGAISQEYENLTGYLRRVAAYIEQFGWTSARKAREEFLLSTAMGALDTMYRPDITPEHKQLVLKTIQWVRYELAEQEDLNDYEWNLVAALSGQYFHLKNAGIAASSIIAYKKAHTLLNGDGSKLTSKHQGELKERLDLTLTVLRRFDTEIDAYSGYGSEVLKTHIMEDEEGNIFVWKTTSRKLAENELYNVRGTVKAHDHYNGTPQTVLTRCKVSCPECGKDDYWWDKGGEVDRGYRYRCGGCEDIAKEEARS